MIVTLRPATVDRVVAMPIPSLKDRRSRRFSRRAGVVTLSLFGRTPRLADFPDEQVL
jgi:hypothetical protein